MAPRLHSLDAFILTLDTPAWMDVWLGALASATLFMIGKWVIGLYLGSTAMVSM